MAIEELDLVEEILGPAPFKRAPARSSRRRARTAAKLIVAFLIGAFGVLVLVCAAALAALSTYSNRVVPGVRVGTVDVSGLSRDEVVARLKTDFAYLGQGEITITTPSGTATMAYQDTGRTPDVDFMADAAIAIGHTGNPIDDAVTMLRSAIDGQTVPIAVRLDPMAVASRVADLAGSSRLLPKDAQASIDFGSLGYKPAITGSSIDAAAISGAIVEGLARSDAPASFQAGSALVEFDPQVTDQDARDALAAAQKISVNVKLAWGGDSQSPNPSPTRTATPAKTFTIDAMTIQSWIVFRTGADGSYRPAIDETQLRSYLAALAPGLATKPVEPSVVFDSAGKPADVKGGKNGMGMDVNATAQAVEAYLATLASGGSPSDTVAMATAPVLPRITPTSLAGMVIMGSGSWTTTFYPGITNGFGANIRTPAKILNGQIVPAGAQFSFLRYMGPIDRAHGFTLGGVIEDGKSDHTGAMGGGICSASTTMFNAAARAGLQIDERHQHYYYIDRYPVGLDATVYSNGYQVWDLKWTNDTPNPIVIRAWATYGSTSKITIQLWSMPLDRKVTFSPAFKANVVRASDHKVFVSSLKPGQQNRAEYPTAGFSTSRTRTVTDSTGKVIHSDTWYSKYKKVDGLLQIGRSAAPPPTPTAPVPAPPAQAILPPAPTAAPGARRRQDG
jgi:vancomycin resistance protein YoaR